MSSLKKQLMIGMLVPLALGLGILLYISYDSTLHEIEEVFDAELAQTAGLMAQLALANLDSRKQQVSNLQSTAKGHKYEKRISYQVWHGNDLVLRSDSAPQTPMSNQPGFSDVVIDDRQWRVFGLYSDDSPYVVYSGEDNNARDELSLEIAIGSLSMLAWALPLFGIIIFFTVSRGLRSLDRISLEVRQQDIHNLSPVNVEKVPAEIFPLVQALNELLARLDAAMSRERQFTSNASHELRTPLSSIRLHAQLALKSDNAEDKQESLQKVIQAVDQSTHLVEQLLLLSKLPTEGQTGNVTEFDLMELCGKVYRQLAECAQNKQIRIDTSSALHGTELIIRNNQQLLHTILRNLLDNAIRYSPDNSSISCRVKKTGDSVVISIQDEGPGIPASQLSQVRQRFFRIAGQEIDGCGLGLSIVEQAARHIGAEFELTNRTDGHSGLIASIRIDNAKT